MLFSIRFYCRFPVQCFVNWYEREASMISLVRTLVLGVIMATVVSCISAGSSMPTEDHHAETGRKPIAQRTVTVHPQEINEVLYNPGMGLADFHFGFEHPPSTDRVPATDGGLLPVVVGRS